MQRSSPVLVPVVESQDLPPSIQATVLKPENLRPPVRIPFEHEPIISPAHPNVYPVGSPSVYQIPEELNTVVIGEDVPLPEVFPAKGVTTHFYQSKPIPALSSRMTDAAIYNIQYLSKDEGLPFGGISIMEDSKGQIWLGTTNGIVRYDGVHFFPFTEQEGIFGGFVMMEDRKGNIWFGSPNMGGGYFDGTQVISFRDQEGIKNNLWNSILEDSHGHIWIGTDKGVFKYDGTDFTFYKKENGLVNDSNQEVGIFFDHRINAMLEDSRGHLWWATQGSGVLRLDGKKLMHYTTKEGLVDNFISCIMEDSQGRIWFGSGGEGVARGKGISVYTPDYKLKGSYGGIFSNYTTKEGLRNNLVQSIIEDSKGNLWIGLGGTGGVSCYDGHTFTNYTDWESIG